MQITHPVKKKVRSDKLRTRPIYCDLNPTCRRVIFFLKIHHILILSSYTVVIGRMGDVGRYDLTVTFYPIISQWIFGARRISLTVGKRRGSTSRSRVHPPNATGISPERAQLRRFKCWGVQLPPLLTPLWGGEISCDFYTRNVSKKIFYALHLQSAPNWGCLNFGACWICLAPYSVSWGAISGDIFTRIPPKGNIRIPIFTKRTKNGKYAPIWKRWAGAFLLPRYQISGGVKII